MPNEVEAKYAIDGFTAVRKALQNAGAEFLGTVLQTDRYYDRADDGLRKQGCGLRLRLHHVLKHGKKRFDSRPLITYKGPLNPSAKVKIRREIQTRLDSGESAHDLMLACGLQLRMTLQKRRSSYRLGRAMVEMDELPLIGKFVEIEGLSESHVESVRKKLHIQAEHIPSSYTKILADACRKIRRSSVEVTFEKFHSPDVK